jgi:hypothetical protein
MTRGMAISPATAIRCSRRRIYPAGVALPIAKARIKVADFEQTVAVRSENRAVSIQVTIARGSVDLQTWFYDRDGNEICGAYFVYVTRP